VKIKGAIFPFRYLQLIGTSAADYEGIENSKNENCIEAVRRGGRNIRKPSSLYIYPDCIIDFSSYAPSQMQRFNIDYNLIGYVVITHPHFDHFHPPSIIDMASKKEDALFVCGSSCTIELLRETVEESMENYKIRMRKFIPWREYRLGNISVIPIEANHTVALTSTEVYLPKKFQANRFRVKCPAFNYIIKIKDKTILYACDTGLPIEKTYQFLKGFKFDVVIHEATFENIEDEGHMNFKKVRELKERMARDEIISDGTLFFLSHLSLNYTPIYDKIWAAFLREGIIVGYDGMVIPL